jgi:hypothetical protein
MRAQIAVLIFLVIPFSLPAQKQPASAPPPAKSQQPSKPAGPAQASNVASREEVMKLLDLLQVPDSLAMTMDAMKEQMKVGALQMFREKVANPSPAQVQSVDAIVDEEFKKIGMEDLIRMWFRFTRSTSRGQTWKP